ncbi:MAG: bifunctional tetrahydrofolate synthase/dihydrofolate synthase [Pseudomonadota bacterium]
MLNRSTPLAQWLSAIEQRHPTAIQLGLDRIGRVLDRLELRQPRATVITVAGTNGKGSTVAFVERIYGQAGLRTGAYTSPHLQRFNERVRVLGEEVDDAILCEAFAAVEAARGANELTYFEFATAAALLVFSRAELDVIVLEVGLGGRLDAVNAVDAAASAVVTVALDHTEWLGDTREHIGWEKAHVYRAGAPAVCGDPDPPQRLLAHAKSIGAPVQVAGRDYRWKHRGETWDFYGACGALCGLPLPAASGAFQLHNASVALSLVQSLQGELPVPEEAIVDGLARAEVRGRLQRCEGPVTWIFDVAHNVQAAQVLASALEQGASDEPGRTLAVFGMMRDKDIEGVVQALTELVDEWWMASLPPPRGVAGDTLEAAVLDVAPNVGGCTHVCTTVEGACEAVHARAQPGDRVVVFGSFLTVGPGLAAYAALAGR